MATTAQQQNRVRAGQLAAGAALLAVWALAAHSVSLAFLTCGALVGAVMFYRRTVTPRPYGYWPAYAAGAAAALLLGSVAGEASRLIYLPLAGIEAVAALVLGMLWHRRRDGSGDWIVWLPDDDTVLRREWSRRHAIRWAQDYGHPCAVSRVDMEPGIAGQTPRYPHHDRPWVRLLEQS